MEVILNKDVEKLGNSGMVVKVKDGFARNFLLAKNLAVAAADGVVKQHQAQATQKAAKEEALLKAAQGILEKLGSTPVLLSAKADEKGHLYAGLKESEILARISRGGETPQKGLSLSNYASLKQSGEYTLTLQTPQNKNIKFKILIKCQS